jgi:hypothetical protein
MHPAEKPAIATAAVSALRFLIDLPFQAGHQLGLVYDRYRHFQPARSGRRGEKYTIASPAFEAMFDVLLSGPVAVLSAGLQS